jgi:hypothetical protein
MPYVTCPTCGERGKIAATLIGARIKCKKCGNSFLVSPPASKVSAAGAIRAALGDEPPPGIAVEGLEASSWSLSTETGVALKAEITADPDPSPVPSPATVSAGPPPAGSPEYKLLTAKDKYFEGKFDLSRLEEALNHFSRNGWAVKAVMTPQIKGFSGAYEETIVVVLER